MNQVIQTILDRPSPSTRVRRLPKDWFVKLHEELGEQVEARRFALHGLVPSVAEAIAPISMVGALVYEFRFEHLRETACRDLIIINDAISRELFSRAPRGHRIRHGSKGDLKSVLYIVRDDTESMATAPAEKLRSVSGESTSGESTSGESTSGESTSGEYLFGKNQQTIRGMGADEPLTVDETRTVRAIKQSPEFDNISKAIETAKETTESGEPRQTWGTPPPGFLDTPPVTPIKPVKPPVQEIAFAPVGRNTQKVYHPHPVQEPAPETPPTQTRGSMPAFTPGPDPRYSPSAAYIAKVQEMGTAYPSRTKKTTPPNPNKTARTVKVTARAQPPVTVKVRTDPSTRRYTFSPRAIDPAQFHRLIDELVEITGER